MESKRLLPASVILSLFSARPVIAINKTETLNLKGKIAKALTDVGWLILVDGVLNQPGKTSMKGAFIITPKLQPPFQYVFPLHKNEFEWGRVHVSVSKEPIDAREKMLNIEWKILPSTQTGMISKWLNDNVLLILNGVHNRALTNAILDKTVEGFGTITKGEGTMMWFMEEAARFQDMIV